MAHVRWQHGHGAVQYDNMIAQHVHVWSLSQRFQVPSRDRHRLQCQLVRLQVVIMDLPLERKSLRGAKKATKPCLLRQSIEVPPTYTGLEFVEDKPTSPPKPKVGRPKKKQPEETIVEEQAVEQAVEPPAAKNKNL